jgi:GH24 family phage-related lysozyme (muramidase)
VMFDTKGITDGVSVIGAGAAAQGWQVRMTTSDEQRRQLGRSLPADLAEASVSSELFPADPADGGE